MSMLTFDIFPILGAAGLVVISAAVWIKKEERQNILFIIGGALLLVYSIYIESVIFSVLQVVFMLSSLIELIQIRRKDKTARQ